mmetsp:Transcript_7827/g.12461  ORF Transcript_7827/g.12461 Transcript_7827/m.12461 type:complete len:234 (-) Transcript_7827:606-1307(-)
MGGNPNAAKIAEFVHKLWNCQDCEPACHACKHTLDHHCQRVKLEASVETQEHGRAARSDHSSEEQDEHEMPQLGSCQHLEVAPRLQVPPVQPDEAEDTFLLLVLWMHRLWQKEGNNKHVEREDHRPHQKKKPEAAIDAPAAIHAEAALGNTVVEAIALHFVQSVLVWKAEPKFVQLQDPDAHNSGNRCGHRGHNRHTRLDAGCSTIHTLPVCSAEEVSKHRFADGLSDVREDG